MTLTVRCSCGLPMQIKAGACDPPYRWCWRCDRQPAQVWWWPFPQGT